MCLRKSENNWPPLGTAQTKANFCIGNTCNMLVTGIVYSNRVATLKSTHLKRAP